MCDIAAAKGSVKSAIKFAFYCVYIVILWFDHNHGIIENRVVLMKIIVMLKITSS